MPKKYPKIQPRTPPITEAMTVNKVIFNTFDGRPITQAANKGSTGIGKIIDSRNDNKYKVFVAILVLATSKDLSIIDLRFTLLK